MIVVISDESGQNSAINLSEHAWDTFPVAGDEASIRMKLDNGKEFVLPKAKFNRILTQLSKTDGFIVLD